jgi:hypothetical protein
MRNVRDVRIAVATYRGLEFEFTCVLASRSDCQGTGYRVFGHIILERVHRYMARPVSSLTVSQLQPPRRRPASSRAVPLSAVKPTRQPAIAWQPYGYAGDADAPNQSGRGAWRLVVVVGAATPQVKPGIVTGCRIDARWLREFFPPTFSSTHLLVWSKRSGHFLGSWQCAASARAELLTRRPWSEGSRVVVECNEADFHVVLIKP